MSVDLQIRGVNELLKLARDMGRRVRNPRPAFEVMANLLELQVAKQFKTAGRRTRQPWRALAPSTVAARVRRTGYYRQASGTRVGILQWTGDLRRSWARGGRGHIRRIRATGLQWGSENPKAGYHQRTRAMLAFTDRQRDLITVEPIRQWIAGTRDDVIFQRIRSRAAL